MQEIIETYNRSRSYHELEHRLKELAADGGYTVVKSLAVLYRLVHFKEERILILKTLIDCQKEKALLETLVEFSFTDDTDALLIILKGFYRFHDNMFHPRTIEILHTTKSTDIKIHCIRILGRIGRKDILPVFDALFDSESVPVCYELLHAMLLIGEHVSATALEKRIIGHKRGNLFLKDKRILETFILAVFHLGGRERRAVLDRYRFYPEKKIALLAGNYRTLIDIEKELFSSDKRAKKYIDSMFELLIKGNAVPREDDADDGQTKTESSAAAAVPATGNEWDISAAIFCKRNRDRLKDDLIAYIKAHVFQFEKYDASIRFFVENIARLDIDYINELLWDVYLSEENKYLLAAVLDNVTGSDTAFIEKVTARLMSTMGTIDAKMIYQRIPFTMIRLKKEQAVVNLLTLASQHLPPEKEEVVFRCLHDALVLKDYYQHLPEGHAGAVNDFFDTVAAGSFSVRAKEITASIIAKLGLDAYEQFILAEFRRDRFNPAFVNAMLDLHTPAIDVELSSLFFDPAIIDHADSYYLNLVLEHFSSHRHETPPIPPETVSRMLGLPQFAPACISYIGTYQLTGMKESLASMLADELPYLTHLRIIETLGMFRDAALLPVFARELYTNDFLTIITSARAVNALSSTAGFSELLSYCTRTDVSDDIKVRILTDVNVSFDNALETIGRIIEISEFAKSPELHAILIDLRLRIDIDDRLAHLKRERGI
ncbi:MAG: HEAT repeat domain-containing protein [Spirochaetes bacterium]|nr:HEAT repeat domain-containing protein [Spirochaetota bacterium]